MEFDVWSQSFVAAMTTLWSKVASFIPDLIAALVIIVLGLIVAKIADVGLGHHGQGGLLVHPLDLCGVRV